VFIRFGRTLNNLAGGLGLTLGLFLLFRVLTAGVEILADYEQANANLAAVTNATAKQLDLLKESSAAYGSTTRFTASEVVGLQTELGKLGFLVPEIINATGAILNLASATNTELPQAAKQVGAAIRAYGLEAIDATRVSDVFAAAISSSALDMEKLDVSMSKIAPIAKQFGFSIENTVALMASLSDAGFDASTMATSTRSIILNLADANGKLARALGRPARTLPEVTQAMIDMRDRGIDLAKLLDLTDKRSVAAAATFLENAESINKMSMAMDNAEGAAKLMALTQIGTLRGSTLLLKSAYEGLVLSLDGGNGTISKTLRKYIDMATAILGMWTQTNTATDTTKQLDLTLFNFQERLDILEFKTKRYKIEILAIAEKMEFWIKVIGGVIAAILVLKGLILITQGISAAFAVTVAIISGAMQVWSAAIWLVNAAMAANPIGIIIAAIVIMIALVVTAIKNWEEWGAALSLFLGPIGLLITSIQSLRRNWELISKSFKDGGIISGLKAIALAFADGIVQQFEQLARLVENFTGLNLGSASLTLARQGLAGGIENAAGVQPTGEVQTNAINPEATRQESFNESITQSIEQNKLSIDINDPNDRASVDEQNTSSGIDVRIDSTFSFSPEQ
jgi:TP901 family phage tail tape measure protein